MSCKFRLEDKTLIIEGEGIIESVPFKLKKKFTEVVFNGDFIKIDKDAFAYCKSLSSVKIPDSVTKIDKGAFYNCTNLKSIKIPDSVTEIVEYAFVKCTNLKNIENHSSCEDSIKNTDVINDKDYRMYYVIQNKEGNFFKSDNASGGYPCFIDNFEFCEKFNSEEFAQNFLNGKYATEMFKEEFDGCVVKKVEMRIA